MRAQGAVGEEVGQPGLRFDDCGFAQNEATGDGVGDGGAVWAHSLASVRVNDSTFEGNHSWHGGAGGVHAAKVTALVAEGSVWSENSSLAGPGGGLWVSEADVRIAGCRFERNSARAAGGLAQVGGALELLDSEFVDNVASLDAGGAALSSVALDASGVTFSGNTAAMGGAMTLHGNGSIARSQFLGNTAESLGGGLLWTGIPPQWDRALAVTDTDFTSNRLEGSAPNWAGVHEWLYGAGLACHLDEPPGDKGVLELTRGRFEDNRQSAGSPGGRLLGGGLSLYFGCDADVDGTEFADNAADSGGGIFVDSTSLTASNLRMEGNDAVSRGGGIAFDRRTTQSPYDWNTFNLADPSLLLSDSLFELNEAASGGALSVDCEPEDGPNWAAAADFDLRVELTDVDVLDNIARSFGGGTYVDSCRLAHTGGTYSGNLAKTGSGGAISAVHPSAPELLQLRFLANEAPQGAGSALSLHVRDGSLANLLAADNEGDGPAVWLTLSGGQPIPMEHLTVANNRRSVGASAAMSGLRVQGSTALLRPSNNLVAANEGMVQVSTSSLVPTGDWLVWHPSALTVGDACTLPTAGVLLAYPDLLPDYELNQGSPASGAGVDANGASVDLGAFGGANGVF